MQNTLKKIFSVLMATTLALGILALNGCNTKPATAEKIVIWAFDYYIDAAKEAVKESMLLLVNLFVSPVVQIVG